MPRMLFAYAWTGSKLVVWGGQDVAWVVYRSGGLFDPATNSWQAMDSTNAPEGRSQSAYVWTGSKMIVWGGVNGPGDALNTGGLYDPIANSWSSTQLSGAPGARYCHTCVWTGSRMIVWGGTYGGIFNTGAIYNPQNNSWTPVTTVNAPAARYNHAAVWASGKMIVWGGISESGTVLNDGGIYDTLTASWSPVSVVNAPVARAYPSAIWTGSRMIVWGGNYDVSYHPLKSGGIFDPVSNSWSTMDSSQAPSARYYHNALYTNDRMIIWGGLGVGVTFNTGGIFNTLTNQWSSTSTVNAPSGRFAAAAVWASDKMIIWGGGHIGVRYNTGGIYTNSAIGIEPLGTEIPESFRLYQNYPNPFNPATRIRFDVPQIDTPPLKGEDAPMVRGGMMTSLVVYDALGREITILVNEQLNPGTYEIEWDASAYSSGIYFYRLYAGEFSDTKKLVLIK